LFWFSPLPNLKPTGLFTHWTSAHRPYKLDCHSHLNTEESKVGIWRCKIGQWKLLNYQDSKITYSDGTAYSKYKWRKLVLYRDKNKCQSCFNSIRCLFTGKTYKNQAHHIYPRRHGGKNTLRNGVTLCEYCHARFDYIYARYGKDYYKIMDRI
jgi:5-methylcytosine-specific restriction endonuclease McrA